jgi:hypothetical protein
MRRKRCRTAESRSRARKFAAAIVTSNRIVLCPHVRGHQLREDKSLPLAFRRHRAPENRKEAGSPSNFPRAADMHSGA